MREGPRISVSGIQEIFLRLVTLQLYEESATPASEKNLKQACHGVDRVALIESGGRWGSSRWGQIGHNIGLDRGHMKHRTDVALGRWEAQTDSRGSEDTGVGVGTDEMRGDLVANSFKRGMSHFRRGSLLAQGLFLIFSGKFHSYCHPSLNLPGSLHSGPQLISIISIIYSALNIQ